ncbi:Sperm acrosome membrane-associated protein 4 Precursor [Channa argus]|uniref:Sperm acrosome membrane-associated protein 4 n=1 Tax=Channa argus TaxID=215402 RepID=A0A6G1QXR7_CHAAH|nr:Sperm acrosome membrane-associated protein 4 Precursor [Channa argus]
MTTGQGLQCYNCDIGNQCTTTTKVTCQDGEKCFSGLGKAADNLDIVSKGCLASDDCDKTEDFEYTAIDPAVTYSLTKTCCDTELCNGGSKLSGASGLALAFTTIIALFVANILI